MSLKTDFKMICQILKVRSVNVEEFFEKLKSISTLCFLLSYYEAYVLFQRHHNIKILSILLDRLCVYRNYTVVVSGKLSQYLLHLVTKRK